MRKGGGRQKGHAYEQALARTFREKGFTECVTSRSESKNTDDKGIDLMFVPINVQAKAVERLGCVHKILEAMPDDKPNVVFHKKNRKGTIVCMKDDFFWELLEVYDKQNGNNKN